MGRAGSSPRSEASKSMSSSLMLGSTFGRLQAGMRASDRWLAGANLLIEPVSYPCTIAPSV